MKQIYDWVNIRFITCILLLCLFIFHKNNYDYLNPINRAPLTQIFYSLMDIENHKVANAYKWFKFKPINKISVPLSDIDHAGIWVPMSPKKGVKGKKIAIILHGFGNGAHKRIDIANLIHNFDESKKIKNYDTILAYEYYSLASIKNIAYQFSKHLKEILPAHTEVDLYGHSMGGLVARWAAEKENLHVPVNRLVTFCTPHHGIPVHVKSFLQGISHYAIAYIGPIFDIIFQQSTNNYRALSIATPILYASNFTQSDPIHYLKDQHACAITDVSTESIGKSPSKFLQDLNKLEMNMSKATEKTTYFTVAGTNLHTLGHKLMDLFFYKPWGAINDGMVPISSAHIYNHHKEEFCEDIKNNYFNIVMPLRHGLICDKNTPIDKFQGLKSLMALMMKEHTQHSISKKKKKYIAKLEDQQKIIRILINSDK